MRIGVLVALCALAAACGDNSGGNSLIDDRFTEAQWMKIQRFTPVPPPPLNPTNKYADNAAAAVLGQRLFFDKEHAGPLTVASELGNVGEEGTVACVTCHDPENFFSDSRPDNKVSIGAGVTGRNAPSLVNVVYYEWGNWAWAHDQMWKQGANGTESRDNFNGSRLKLAHIMYAKYKDDYNAIFPIPLDPALDPSAPDAARFPATGKPKSSGAPDGPWEMMTAEDRFIVNTIMANVGKCYEAYERKLVSRNAPFDRYVEGDFTALSASAKRGLELFIGKAACDSCHNDVTFTDNKTHNTGVMQTRDPQDQGMFDDLPKAISNTFSGAGMFSDNPAAGQAKFDGLVVSDDMKGKFRTKSLRHLTKTGPYFHDGSMPTLEAVVRFYNDGGGATGFPGTKDPLLVPLNLTEGEIADLVAFLESLTGDPVDPALRMNISR